MWDRNHKYLNSKFRPSNLKHLNFEPTNEYNKSKEIISSIKIFLRIAKKYNVKALKYLCENYQRITLHIEHYINMNKNKNKDEDKDIKWDTLEKFKFCIINKNYTKACDYAAVALQQFMNLITIINNGNTRLNSYLVDDYMHIIASSAFRRLQDKAQVYSLEEEDFARTRLTHSFEVAANAEIIATNIDFNKLLKSNSNYPYLNQDIVLIVRCVSLLHDIGNPPFGHFGEEVIKDFFLNDYKKEFKKRKIKAKNPFYLDFCKFDGNAQALRIAAKLQYFGNKNGLYLPAAVLGALIKYPFSSSDAPKSKFGYFASEADLINLLEVFGVFEKNVRNPLALILEASDDISYVTADLEDAIHKRIITIESFELLKKGDAESQKLYEKIHNYYQENIENKTQLKTYEDIFEQTMRPIIADIRHDLLMDAVDTFKTNSNLIINKGVECDMVTGKSFTIVNNLNKYKELYHNLSEILKTVFNVKDVIINEIKGYDILKKLLRVFCDAVVTANCDIKEKTLTNKNQYYNRILNLISTDFKNVFFDEISKKGITSQEIFYYKMHLVVDYISGMTDSYAYNLYKEIK